MSLVLHCTSVVLYMLYRSVYVTSVTLYKCCIVYVVQECILVIKII